MKKIVICVLLACFVLASAFANSYTVENVTGRVQRESGRNLIDVKTGDVLAENAVIRTAVGSSIVLDNNGSKVTIPAGRNGSVSELIEAASRVRITGNVTRVDTGAIARSAGQVSTASARASDAAADEDIVAE